MAAVTTRDCIVDALAKNGTVLTRETLDALDRAMVSLMSRKLYEQRDQIGEALKSRRLFLFGHIDGTFTVKDK